MLSCVWCCVLHFHDGVIWFNEPGSKEMFLMMTNDGWMDGSTEWTSWWWRWSTISLNTETFQWKERKERIKWNFQWKNVVKNRNTKR